MRRYRIALVALVLAAAAVTGVAALDSSAIGAQKTDNRADLVWNLKTKPVVLADLVWDTSVTQKP